MNRSFRKLPLPIKLILLVLVPLLLLLYLSFRLYNERSQKIELLDDYIGRIEQSALLTHLIDNLQVERQHSYYYVLKKDRQLQMLQQRRKTDSVIRLLNANLDVTLKGYETYTFVDSLAGFRKMIDNGIAVTDHVVNYYSTTIFRLNTLNGITPGNNIILNPVYSDLGAQKLISEMTTYLGIINANIFNILYNRKYVVEILAGTYPSFVVYKSYEKEFLQKASPGLLAQYNDLRTNSDLKKNIDYLEKAFVSFKIDSSYQFIQWEALSLRSINSLRKLQMNVLNAVQDDIQAIYEKEKTAQTRALILLVFALALVFMLITYTIFTISKMLNELKYAALRIAKGETGFQLKNESNDVIGSLAHSISEIDESNRTLAEAARSIGEGNFDVPLHPRSGQDLLGNALLQMKDNLQRSTRETEESREQFRQLADFVPQIIWTAPPNGAVDYFNKQWYEFTGAEKVFGDAGFIPSLHPDDVEHCLNTWYNSVKTEKPYEIEYRIRARDGSYRWFLGRAVPVKNAEGEIVRWFGSCTDIHEHKTTSTKLESLVKERTEELQRSNEDLQQFAHIASHDLKEPLRKIRIFSSRLQEEFGKTLPEAGNVYINKIEQASERMSAMIDGVLNYSMANNMGQSFDSVDLNEIIDQVKQDLELLIQQKRAIIEHPVLPTVRGVRVLIYQLFYNLINNALKFSKETEPNTITINVRNLRGNEVNGTTKLNRSRDYFAIQVNDTGIGFDQSHSEKMFQIFSRLNPKDQYEGTGLGLALCKKIVQRHNGAITATGRQNEGASFQIYLPAE